jgi:chorismate synthase
MGDGSARQDAAIVVTGVVIKLIIRRYVSVVASIELSINDLG